MRKIPYFIVIAALVIGFNGCAKSEPKKEVLAAIGKYTLYKEDLLSEVELYPPAYRAKISKEEMLDTLIQKKILLLEAQRQGLDKDPAFMKMVERFWEQSLLRSLLDKKSDEILSSIEGPEKERTEKAKLIMRQWVEDLEKNANININKEALEKIEIR